MPKVPFYMGALVLPIPETGGSSDNHLGLDHLKWAYCIAHYMGLPLKLHLVQNTVIQAVM